MKKILGSLLLVAALGGCVSDNTMYLPDGREGHHISCGGAHFNMSDCYHRAGEICGEAGYRIVGQNGEALNYSIGSGVPTSRAGGGLSLGPTMFSSSSGSVISRDLFVTCLRPGETSMSNLMPAVADKDITLQKVFTVPISNPKYEAFRAEDKVCLQKNAAGEVKTPSGLMRCATAAATTFFKQINYPYMDLVQRYNKARIEGAEQWETGIITAQEANTQINALKLELVAEEMKRNGKH